MAYKINSPYGKITVESKIKNELFTKKIRKIRDELFQLNQEIIKEESDLKNRGFNYKIDYWVHNEDVGDDINRFVYLKEKPSDIQLENLMRKRLKNSVVKNDYVLSEI